MRNQFTAIIFKSGKWWVGCAAEIPGANTQGRTLKEVRENLHEAISMILEDNRQNAIENIGKRRIRRETIEVEV